MQTDWFQNLYISVGIDVGADFSWMSIALPNQTFHGRPFKIIHSDLDSLTLAVSKIKEAEELHSLEIRIFLESTGIYHYPLFCYLRDKGFNVSVVNPIITKNSTNINIRKVHNDPADSKKAALIGLKPDLKTSLIPSDLVLDLRNLCREYYDLMNSRSAYVNKLHGELRMVFPQYLGIFSKITTDTSLTLLEAYGSPLAFLDAPKEKIIKSIQRTSRFGPAYAQSKCQAIHKAAGDALVFGHSVPSNFKRMRRFIHAIRQYDQQIAAVLSDLHELVDAHEGTKPVEQIRLIESYPGAGFLSAVSLIAEIGDFSAFQSPKQLFAYLGLDPAVKKSGKWEGTKTSMSKRGSSIARRVIHTMAIQGIRRSRDGSASNPVLRDYYEQKCLSKPKKVALGAVMHKVCNIVFAILRDETPYRVITPEEHRQNYLKAKCGIAA
jgi:transposase